MADPKGRISLYIFVHKHSRHVSRNCIQFLWRQLEKARGRESPPEPGLF